MQMNQQNSGLDFLPKDQKDLKEASYWKKFFEFDRFKDGFEWYASFEDLTAYLKQHIKDSESTQKIIVPGCGNSDLSVKLLTKLGVSNLDIVSMDYEESVVKKMEDSKPKGLPLVYQVGDVTNLKAYKDEEFQCAIDKGTLDAIAVDADEATVKMCNAYFNEIIRVLNNKDGVFMFVSLLQPHVLKIVTDFFIANNEVNKHQKSNLFQVRIQKIEHIEGYAEKQFLKYFVSIKKNLIKQDEPTMLELREKMQHYVFIQDSWAQKGSNFVLEQALEKIKVDQQVYMIAPTMKALDQGRQIEMHCFDYKAEVNQNLPKYTLWCVDSNDEFYLKTKSQGAIIIPQGRQRESAFGTEFGRQNLTTQTKFSRVVIIYLGYGHKFADLKTIQEELNAKLLDLSPTDCSNYAEIPIMTVADNVGEVALLETQIPGLIIQDIKSEDMILRQVIFESKPDQIQSEMQIVYRDPKKHEIPDNQFTSSVIAPAKKGKKTVFNFSFLTNEYQQAMLSGLYQANSIAEKKELNILNLGTGAGIMPMFLNSHLGDKIKKITTIDINEGMLKVAKDHFGFKTEGTNIESIQGDAYEFINNATNKGEYDIIIMDVNYSEDDKSISPPWKFLETEFLQKVADLANPESAYLAFNLLYYSDLSRQRVIDNFKALEGFDTKSFTEMDGESNNKIFMLARNKTVNFKNNLPVENTKLLESMLKDLDIRDRGIWLNDMSMKDHHHHIQQLENAETKKKSAKK